VALERTDVSEEFSASFIRVTGIGENLKSYKKVTFIFVYHEHILCTHTHTHTHKQSYSEFMMITMLLLAQNGKDNIVLISELTQAKIPQSQSPFIVLFLSFILLVCQCTLVYGCEFWKVRMQHQNRINPANNFTLYS
jgi:hypothetical protein